MQTMLTSLIPTSSELTEALHQTREAAGAPAWRGGRDEPVLQVWEYPGGPCIVVAPLHPATRSWVVRVLSYGAGRTVLERVSITGSVNCSLQTAEGRSRLIKHVEWVRALWRNISSIPALPGPLAQQLRTYLVERSDEAFQWKRSDDSVRLVLGNLPQIMLRDYAEPTGYSSGNSFQLEAQISAIVSGRQLADPKCAIAGVRRHLAALLGVGGPIVDLLMYLTPEDVRRLPPARLAGSDILERIRRWTTVGQPAAADCLSPRDIASEFVNALVIQYQLGIVLS